MGIPAALRPQFWGHGADVSGPFGHLFNFHRLWRLAILSTSLVAIVPLVALLILDYNVTRQTAQSGIFQGTAQTASNTWRSLSHFLDERRNALTFVARDNSLAALSRPGRLGEILAGLKDSVGGFTDLGLIDRQGRQLAYVGPHDLLGVDYSREEWFSEVVRRGVYVSEVYLGLRNVPHLVIAVCTGQEDGSWHVLRATIDTERFNRQLDLLELDKYGDAFLVNQDGVLQTPSRRHGDVFSRLAIAVPRATEQTQVFVHDKGAAGAWVIAAVHIPESPFVLMIVKQMDELMRPWLVRRTLLIAFVGASILLIVLVTLAMATHLVNRIYLADRERLVSLRMVEHADKLASIGRLAAGVAHEINNPLAIVNEKAGLLKDLLTFKKEYAGDPRLLALADTIIASVERCGVITKRLLGFARHLDVQVQQVHLKDVVEDVLGFLHKEAQYRSITVRVALPGDLPAIETDRGKLQQIVLNIVNNAFQAMADGGHLEIGAERRDGMVALGIRDDGCGIAAEDLQRIFEPFFSTKTDSGGTGLGLSITHGLARELQGRLEVDSAPGKGSTFTILLPLSRNSSPVGRGQTKEDGNAPAAG